MVLLGGPELESEIGLRPMHRRGALRRVSGQALCLRERYATRTSTRIGQGFLAARGMTISFHRLMTENRLPKLPAISNSAGRFFQEVVNVLASSLRDFAGG